MTTVRDVVDRARGLASGGMGDTLNALAVPYVPGSGTLTLKYPAVGVAPGMTLSCGLTTFYVVGTSGVSGVLQVMAAPNGGPDLAAAEGAVVRLKPRYTDWAIFQYVNDQIALMSSSAHGLFSVVSWQDTVDPAWNTYRVPAIYQGIRDVVRVRHLVVGSPDQWTDLRKWSVQFDNDGGITVRNFQTDIQFGTMEFVGKAPFTQATALDDDIVVDCGLAESMLDIPMLGAASLLLASSEAQRLQLRATGEGRRPTEVQVEGNTSLANNLAVRRDRRFGEEYARLQQRYSFQRGRW